jgi:hypothetical protein
MDMFLRSVAWRRLLLLLWVEECRELNGRDAVVADIVKEDFVSQGVVVVLFVNVGGTRLPMVVVV